MSAAQITLTADLFARAVVAAARTAEADPLAVMAAPAKSRLLQVRIAAASAIARLEMCPVATAARVLRVGVQSVYGARTKSARPGAGRGGHSPEAAAAFRIAEAAAQAAALRAGQAAPALPTEPEPPPAPKPPPKRPAVDDSVRSPIARPRPAPPAAPKPVVATGPITSWIAPSPGLPSLPEADRPLSDRILEVLADGSATPMGLASILGAKEALVGQSLSVLRHAGLVAADPPPPEGVRQQRHRLVCTAQARDAVLVALGLSDPMTGPDLMAATGLGEGEVRAALNDLAEAGQVIASARTREGWAAQFWRRPAEEQAA